MAAKEKPSVLPRALLILFGAALFLDIPASRAYYEHNAWTEQLGRYLFHGIHEVYKIPLSFTLFEVLSYAAAGLILVRWGSQRSRFWLLLALSAMIIPLACAFGAMTGVLRGNTLSLAFSQLHFIPMIPVWMVIGYYLGTRPIELIRAARILFWVCIWRSLYAIYVFLFVYSWTKVSGAGTISFGSANAVSTTISASLDGAYTLRLTATDLAGNTASDDMILTWDATAPNNVTGLSAVPDVKAINLSWASGGGGAQSYLVLRSTATLTAVPVQGMIYTAGTALGAATVASVGNALTFGDTILTGRTNYFYKVFAYDALGNYASGVQTSAVAEPVKTLKPTLTRSGFFNSTKIMGLRNAGNYTYVCKESLGLAIVNVTNPAAPVQTSLHSLGNTSSVGWCSDVKISGNTAFVANWEKGLMTVDISNPATPVLKGSVVLTNASVLWIEGSYVYVAVEDDDTGGGLAIVNVANLASPTLVSFTQTDGNAAGIGKIGNYVYLSHRDTGNFTGMKVFDVSNLAAPMLVKTFVRNSMEELVISASHVYVAAGFDGVEVFDATNPANPISRSVRVMPDLPDAGYVISVNVSGNYVFATSYDTMKMYVLDFTNKAAATVARSYSTYSSISPLFLHVSGAYAYVSLEGKGMEIIEVFSLQN